MTGLQGECVRGHYFLYIFRPRKGPPSDISKTPGA